MTKFPRLASLDEKIALENLIDSIGTPNLLACVAEILAEKAENYAVNWQDARTAKHWLKASAEVETCRLEVADRIG